MKLLQTCIRDGLNLKIGFIAFLMSAFLITLCLGCGDSGGGKTDDGGLPDSTVLPDTGLQGNASLSFTPVWGPNAGGQFVGNAWKAYIDNNVYTPASEDFRDTRLVIMLCDLEDVFCENPVLLREIQESETSGDPIQNSFGPDIVATRLPEGTYLFMVFADTGLSRAMGYGWQDGFDTKETAWGGVVSELDIMLSDQEVEPSPGVNPIPIPMEVTLVDDEETALDTLRMQHVHERDLSPDPVSENGLIAVAVEDGLRLIDLNTHSVVETAEGSGSYSFEMKDTDNQPLTGTVCGMVRGTGSTVFLLFDDSSEGGAGYVVPFDVETRTQLHGGRRVMLPGTDNHMPCRGLYHAGEGDRGYLWITNASASRMNTNEAAADEGIWHAEVSGLVDGDVSAGYLAGQDDALLQYGIDDFAAHGNVLYMSFTGTSTSGAAPEPCRGAHCVFVAEFDEDTGAPDLQSLGDYEYYVGPEIGQSYVNEEDEVLCGDDASPWAGITTVQFHDGRVFVFLGGCLEIKAFDTATGEEVDMSATGTLRGLDATLFGKAFNSFALSPDSLTLWALPQVKSSIHFYIRRGIIEPELRQTFNRYMALPIDLSQGDAPGLHPDYSGDDIDNFEGQWSAESYTTPGSDPGVDINYGWYVDYQMRWLPSSNGETFQSASIPVGPSLTVTKHALWVRGSGALGQSGLGKGGNLAVYDLETRRAVLWPWGGFDFYPYWLGGPQENPYSTAGLAPPMLGFDLSPEDALDHPTRGIEYFSLD